MAAAMVALVEKPIAIAAIKAPPTTAIPTAATATTAIPTAVAPLIEIAAILATRIHTAAILTAVGLPIANGAILATRIRTAAILITSHRAVLRAIAAALTKMTGVSLPLVPKMIGAHPQLAPKMIGTPLARATPTGAPPVVAVMMIGVIAKHPAMTAASVNNLEMSGVPRTVMVTLAMTVVPPVHLKA